jgi:hypothetical protein
MMKKQSAKLMKLAGIMMLVSGFTLVILNTINYFLTLNIQTSSGPFGLIMLATGSVLLIRPLQEKQSAKE